MSKAKPATKPTAAAATLLEKCRNKKNSFVVGELPQEQFDTVIEMFTAYRDNPGKYSMRTIAAVLTEAFGTRLTRNMLDAAFAEFKLGKLKKAT